MKGIPNVTFLFAAALSGCLGMGDDSAIESNGPWKSVRALPVSLYDAAAVAQGGKIYISGGSHSDASMASLYAYDPVTDVWEKKADMPRGRERHSLVAYHNRLFVIGGRREPGPGHANIGATVAFIYDPAGNTWDSIAPLPTVVERAAAVVQGDRLWIFPPGAHYSISLVYRPDPSGWDYDTASEFSSQSLFPNDSIPEDMTNTSGAVIDTLKGKAISVCGGTPFLVERDPTGGKVKRTLVYYKAIRFLAAGAIIRDLMYVAGGHRPNEPANKDLLAVDPGDGKWYRRSPMQIPRRRHAAVEFGGRLFVFGGIGANEQPLASVEVYNPAMDSVKVNMALEDQISPE